MPERINRENSLNSDLPKGFEKHLFRKQISISHDQLDDFWSRLNLRETFVKGQPFPYRVEFDASTQSGEFRSGELNIHHGPLLSVHGAIGDITDTYRDLKYFYGSYVLSFRLVRPTRLEFFRNAKGIEVRLHTFVKPWFKPIWNLGNKFFWSFFRV